ATGGGSGGDRGGPPGRLGRLPGGAGAADRPVLLERGARDVRVAPDRDRATGRRLRRAPRGGGGALPRLARQQVGAGGLPEPGARPGRPVGGGGRRAAAVGGPERRAGAGLDLRRRHLRLRRGHLLGGVRPATGRVGLGPDVAAGRRRRRGDRAPHALERDGRGRGGLAGRGRDRADGRGGDDRVRLPRDRGGDAAGRPAGLAVHQPGGPGAPHGALPDAGAHHPGGRLGHGRGLHERDADPASELVGRERLGRLRGAHVARAGRRDRVRPGSGDLRRALLRRGPGDRDAAPGRGHGPGVH
ncbi:MAG: hypothetical protein AVDCRST_MAG59-3914, partial [uncultured Thermomicrobiales bacterium]